VQPNAARSARDTFLGAAAATLAVAYLLAAAANIETYVDNLAREPAGLFDNAYYAASLWVTVSLYLLLVAAFVVIAVAFFSGGAARGPRLGCGALILAGGFGLMMPAAVLACFFFSDPFVPEGLLSAMIMRVVAGLSALIAALLVATTFGRPRFASALGAMARNRRLGWASIGVGVAFVLLLLSGFITVPVGEDGWSVDLADAVSLAAIAAIAAALVATIGFFGAARSYLVPASRTMARREGVLAIAATLFLLYRLLDLIDLRHQASWLWRSESVALTVAALCVAAGFVVSRRSFSGHNDP